MKMQSAQSRHPKSGTGMSAAILLGALALTSVVDGLGVPVLAAASPVLEERLTWSRHTMCEECGVVATTSRIAQANGEEMVAALTQYEVTVRMRDGSIRTFIEASSVHWRSGERIILIKGAGPSISKEDFKATRKTVAGDYGVAWE